MSLNPEAYAQAKAIFHRALELEGAERLKLIHRECEGKEDIRTEVLSLLRVHEGLRKPEPPPFSKVKIAFETTQVNCLQRRFRKLVSQRPVRLALLMSLLFLLLLAGLLIRDNLRKSLEREVVGHLESVLNSNFLAVDLWSRHRFEEVSHWAGALSKKPELYELLRLARTSANTRDFLAAAKEQIEIRKALEEGLKLGPYNHFVIFDDRYQNIASDVAGLVGARLTPDTDVILIYERVLAGENVIAPRKLLGTATRDPAPLQAKRYYSWFSVPIRDPSGTIIAGLSLAIEATRNFDQIVGVGRWGDSAETYAFDVNGRMLSESRFQTQDAATKFIKPNSGNELDLKDPGGDLTAGFQPENPVTQWPFTKIVSQALDKVRGYTGETKGQMLEPYRDYRGVPVIGSWRWHPRLNFGLITEIDAKEALATLHFVDVLFLILGILTIALTLLSTTFSFSLMRLGPQARLGARMGQYTLMRKIAEGGIGEIYLARHEFLKRPTAIKILKPDLTDPDSMNRFEKEVRATSQLSHPNTVAIFDFGKTTDRRFYYAMEYLPGISLAKLIEYEEQLPVHRTIYLLKQMCASLKEAHALGLIHRDIKPLNIMICRIGGEFDFVKMVDFGLVKSIKDVVLSETTDPLPQSLRGTPAYIAPELLRDPLGANVRTDVYSLGVVAYKMLTGISLFNAASEASLLYDVLHTAPVPIHQARPDLPPAFSQLIMRCVDKNPLNRPQNMDDLAKALEDIPLEMNWTQTQARLWWNTRDHLLFPNQG